ncbi:MAG: flagellar hook-associated protein FlgK [Myxococcales bacterium]|nr:flagellar hook-associated protein FlgK [Myxococcales bacterium]
MSSLFGLLGSGATGLRANGFAMSVTSQNAQNASTAGYTRRDVRLSPLAPPPDGGGGVTVRGSRRIMDELLDRRVLGATARRAGAEAKLETLSALDRIFADFEGGLGDSLDAFESALTELTDRPSDPATRGQVLAAAERLASAFQDAATSLDQAREDADARIEAEVDGIDETLSAIGSLGIQIQKAEISGMEASDLRDQRDQLVRELAEKLPVTTQEDGQGGMTVRLGGLTLVGPDGSTATLGTTVDATTGELRITRRTAGLDQDVTDLIDGGALGGMVEARTGALTEAETALDQLAFDLANAYDAVHTVGFGTDGASGRNLFTPPTSVDGAAAAFSVSADVAGHPEYLAAATDPTLAAGDNRNALALAAVADSSIGAGGTAQATFGAMLGRAGQAVRGATLEVSVATDMATQLDGLRASVSGVSVDEEMVALAQYQRGYQASLRVIEAADQMLQELVNLGR